jgi:putative PEP-CTERM system histidine kinase
MSVKELIGFIVLGENFASNDYNYEDYDLLKTLAKQSAFAIMKTKLTEELSETREFEAVGKLSSFIIHDLKNAASLLTLVTQNAHEHMNNPQFQKDAMTSVASTSEKIKVIIQKIKDLPKKFHMNFEYADLGQVVSEAVYELQMQGDTKIIYNVNKPINTLFDREEIRKVVTNLLINAIDATKGEGNIRVKTGVQRKMGYIKVSDNGYGMSEEFIEKKLFKPFQTTKKKGLGLGLYQSKTITEAHSGRLEVKSIEGIGTDFTVYIPVRQK